MTTKHPHLPKAVVRLASVLRILDPAQGRLSRAQSGGTGPAAGLDNQASDTLFPVLP